MPRPRPTNPPLPPTHWSILLSPITNPSNPTILSTLSSATKTHLLTHIANDIKTALITISQHLEAGTLGSKHTGAIEDVIAVITGVEKEHRRDLERRVRRLEAREKRRRRRWRRERVWTRACFEGLLGKATEMSGRWRERVRDLEERERQMRRGLGLGGGRGTENGEGRDP